MSKAYYHNLPTVMCKILGVYTVRFDNKDSGRKAVENVVVMENIFYQVSTARQACDVSLWPMSWCVGVYLWGGDANFLVPLMPGSLQRL
jgi:hypothetical protein